MAEAAIAAGILFAARYAMLKLRARAAPRAAAAAPATGGAPASVSSLPTASEYSPGDMVQVGGVPHVLTDQKTWQPVEYLPPAVTEAAPSVSPAGPGSAPASGLTETSPASANVEIGAGELFTTRSRLQVL